MGRSWLRRCRLVVGLSEAGRRVRLHVRMRSSAIRATSTARKQTGQEGRGAGDIRGVGVCAPRVSTLAGAGEVCLQAPLLSAGQSNVQPQEDGEHEKGDQGGPLYEETDHDRDESEVLGVAHIAIRPPGRDYSRPLRRVQVGPRLGNEEEPADDEDIAGEVDRVGMRVAAPPEERLPEVPF